MSVLILDSEAPYAVEILQSLGRKGIAVDVASRKTDCLAFRSKYSRKQLKQPAGASGGDLVEWTRKLDAATPYRWIVPASECSLAFMAELNEDDPLRRKAQLPPADSLLTALNKEKTRAVANQCGVRTPNTLFITDFESAREVSAPWTFPMVLKPTTSRVWEGDQPLYLRPSIVKTAEERTRALKAMLRHTPLLQQEFAPGSGFGIEMLYRNGEMVWHFAHQRIHELPLTGGASTYRRSIAPPAGLLRAAKSILDRLSWHGWAMVEFRASPTNLDAFSLMEINPRAWGSIALSIDAGVDFPFALYQIACGDSPGSQPDYQVHYYTRDIARDFDWLSANWRADHSDPMLLTTPRLRSLVELFRPMLGRESWDNLDWRDLGVIRKNIGRATACIANKVFPARTKTGSPSEL